MKKIKHQFDQKQIVPYIMVGDGGVNQSCALLDLYVKAGCRVIEIGVPFSDPVADGITIQQAAIRSLKENITIKDCLDFIAKGKNKYPNVSLVLMTYLNPIIHFGVKRFFEYSQADGLIIPDMPIEEYDLIYNLALANNCDIIPLITIDTPRERMKSILEKSSGFVYVITIKGITGTQKATPVASIATLKSLRELTDLPLVAGFGIQSQAQVETFHEYFDGVVIASQLIRYAQNNQFEAISQLLNVQKTVM